MATHIAVTTAGALLGCSWLPAVLQSHDVGNELGTDVKGLKLRAWGTC